MRALRLVIRTLSAAAAAALAAMSLVTVVDIAMANAAGRPITGVYELVEICLACVVFLGLAETFGSHTNITVDVIDHFVPGRVLTALRVGGAALSVLFLCLLLWAMFGPAGDALRFGDRKADTGIPVFALWIPIVAGTVVSIIAGAFALRCLLLEAKRKDSGL